MRFGQKSLKFLRRQARCLPGEAQGRQWEATADNIPNKCDPGPWAARRTPYPEFPWTYNDPLVTSGVPGLDTGGFVCYSADTCAWAPSIHRGPRTTCQPLSKALETALLKATRPASLQGFYSKGGVQPDSNF